jgi:uncharacterized membrane protein YoaK (UPF0700 family)
MCASREQRWPIVVAAVLTFGAGALDVIALTHLGGVFASVMTGNLALLGLGIARADGSAVIHAVLAICSYVIGVAAGVRITGARDPSSPQWPRSVTATLSVQFVVQCALAIGWAISNGHPDGAVQLGLLAAAAASMGLQGAAMRDLGVPLATTYLTGTLTGLIAARAQVPRARSNASDVAALIAAVAGAACCGLLLMVAPSAAPLLCVGPPAAVIATAEWRRWLRPRQREE